MTITLSEEPDPISLERFPRHRGVHDARQTYNARSLDAYWRASGRAIVPHTRRVASPELFAAVGRKMADYRRTQQRAEQRARARERHAADPLGRSNAPPESFPFDPVHWHENGVPLTDLTAAVKTLLKSVLESPAERWAARDARERVYATLGPWRLMRTARNALVVRGPDGADELRFAGETIDGQAVVHAGPRTRGLVAGVARSWPGRLLVVMRTPRGAYEFVR